jgi:hypothetical protein
MSAQARDERKVEVEDILEPFYCGGGLVSEDFDEVWSCEVTG